MSHIPQHLLLPQDKVDVLDKGPEDEPFERPTVLRMHASDARHAMDVDPKRYVLAGLKQPDPEAEPQPEPTHEPDPQPETGADGPAWYPQENPLD